MTFLNSEDGEKQTVLQLKSGEKSGSVYCERKADDKAVISLGSFFLTKEGLKENIPLTGLTFTLDKVTEPGAKELTDVVFNVEDSLPSSPECILNSEGIVGSKFKAHIQCADNMERENWGYLLIKAIFSCSF